MFDSRDHSPRQYPAKFEAQIQHGLARILFDQAARANAGVLTIGAIYAIANIGTVSGPALIGWLSLLWGLAIVRLRMLYRFRRQDGDDNDVRPWVWRYSLATLLVGVTWAWIPVYFVSQTEIWQFGLSLFVIAGVVSAGVTVLSAHTPALLLYITPPALGLVYQAVVAETPYGIELLLSVVIYWFFVVGSGIQQHQILVESLVLRFEHERLVEDLRETGEAAQAASQAKSRFLAKISHEIRTPMNGILGVLELLVRTPLDERQRRLTDTIRRSADGLMYLINDLLDLSKIEAGRLEMHPEDFTLNRCADEVVELFEPAASAKGIALHSHVDKDLPRKLHGDWRRLQQALTNLINNAVKFTDQGKIELRIEDLGGDEGQQRLRFSVQDTGIGISPTDSTRIFSPFIQVDDSSTRRYAGTGLGLAIARQLVAQLGGEIRLESVLGEGAHFYFELTFGVVRENLDGETDATHSLPGQDQGLNILLAEDNPINQMVAQEMLELLGCRVRIVENGGDAVNLACGERFDVILLDRHMPQMDGFTAALRIREHEAEQGLAHTVLIAVSASAYASDRQAAKQAGLDGYLTKPFTLDQLRPLLMAVRSARDDGNSLWQVVLPQTNRV